MPERQAGEPDESGAVGTTRLGREFAQLFDQVIEVALGELFTAVAERGFGFAELLVLRALANGSPSSGLPSRQTNRRSLACATGLSAETVTDVVLGLEGQGLITSARAGTVSLTTDGHTLLRDLRSRRLKALTDFVRNRDRGERLRLAGALHLLDARFGG